MESVLKLMEAIWEITPRCPKACEYCGSKKITNLPHPPMRDLRKIATELVKYKVPTVILSGGEPSCLPVNSLEEIINILTDGGCDVRILTNGGMVDGYLPHFLDKVSVIGVTINTLEDIKNSKNYNRKDTMITNFGTHNIFSFDNFAEEAKKYKNWQIQLTMGEFLLPAEGISYLRKKISNLNWKNYILADNLPEEHFCTAGINTCGITFDGYVIPCLSERSCQKDCSVFKSLEANLFKHSLKDIWETQFREIRFKGGWKKSCRNYIKYPKTKKTKESKKTENNVIKSIIEKNQKEPCDPNPFIHPRITLYGVGDNNTVIVYGVGRSSTFNNFHE